jgi:hypothetical protein
MSPRRRREDDEGPDDDEDDGDLSAVIRFVPDPPQTQSVKDAFANAKRRAASVKAAYQMWLPILESYRQYADKMTFVPWQDR